MLNWNHRANMNGKKYPPGRTSIPLTEPKIERLEKQFLKVKIWHTDSKDYSKGNIVGKRKNETSHCLAFNTTQELLQN